MKCDKHDNSASKEEERCVTVLPQGHFKSLQGDIQFMLKTDLKEHLMCSEKAHKKIRFHPEEIVIML